MPILLSPAGSLQAVNALAAPTLAAPYATGNGSSWVAGYGIDPAVYAAIYRTQPAVRTVIDFLARNLAQLGIHVFRRVSDTDRVRLAGHELADWLDHPNPSTTRYRLIETLVQDVCIYWNAYWLKVRLGERVGLVRLPPEQMQVVGGLLPSAFVWTPPATGEQIEIQPSEIVYIGGYDPANPLMGLSPLETLRRVLAEDVAAMRHREAFWRNAARIEGVIETSPAAKALSPEQVESFRSQWHAKFGGEAGVGSVPLLLPGQTLKTMSFSPRQAEYVNARKLTLEEVTREYHVPLPMVGILDHATYSNVREQRKQLYQDTLGPWTIWLAEEIERQLLIDCRDRQNVYLEFNIAAKLAGAFEEQAAALQTLVGRPIMTVNEGRARLNLPADDAPSSDEVAAPLNMATPSPTVGDAALSDAIEHDVVAVIERAWKRQAAVVGKFAPVNRAQAFDVERWSRELVVDLEPRYRAAGDDPTHATQRAERVAYLVNTDTLTLLTAGAAAFSPHRDARSYAEAA